MLAESYSKNEKYLGRVFKSDMGISFSEYCNSLKLSKAARMLLDSKDKVIDIALECGFNNIAYFNRLFSKVYGISPSEYRSTNRT
jgi:AraC-like DNA-binding protein